MEDVGGGGCQHSLIFKLEEDSLLCDIGAGRVHHALCFRLSSGTMAPVLPYRGHLWIREHSLRWTKYFPSCSFPSCSCSCSCSCSYSFSCSFPTCCSCSSDQNSTWAMNPLPPRCLSGNCRSTLSVHLLALKLLYRIHQLVSLRFLPFSYILVLSNQPAFAALPNTN